MPQKSKLNAEEKVEIIRKYQQGKISLGCVVTSFYQSLQAMSSFLLFSICATYCTLSIGRSELN